MNGRAVRRRQLVVSIAELVFSGRTARNGQRGAAATYARVTGLSARGSLTRARDVRYGGDEVGS